MSKGYGFIRVAAVTPSLKVGDVDYNISQIIKFAEDADKKGVQITVFPELAITSYTLADLLQNQLLLEKALEGLDKIRKASLGLKSLIIVGLPLALEGKIFNAAAVVQKGKILGVVPKTYIPGYKEFYEERWFASARDLIGKEIRLGSLASKCPIGTDILFKDKNNPEVILGIEICEDLWGPMPPSSFQVIAGANIIANLSASNELVGKADYRRTLVAQQSARSICGYIYSSCGVHESTTDVVFSGHCLIAEDGILLTESERFNLEGEMIINEIDIEHLTLNREKTTSFGEAIHEARKDFRFVEMILGTRSDLVYRYIDPHPFTPKDNAERDKRVQEIFLIQTSGLVKRLLYTKIKKIVIGLSGGLDSTLALLVAAKACQVLNLPLKTIHAITMPGFATTKRTKSNAVKLAEVLGIEIETIDITKGSLQQFEDIGHDDKTQDLTYENVQARYRTFTMMNKANQIGGLVLGTGDLSEIALGWNTFTGDQISHYNVNAGVPKTLVKYLVAWASNRDEFKKAKKVLADILDTPISPELKREKKEISQKTEDIIGPYELHDFYLYHFVRWNSSPSKIIFLAQKAFGDKYPVVILKKWLKLFIKRFFGNQWKRSVMPDGPKVGSVALSPRGDWRMPSDAEVSLWIKDLDKN